MKIFKTLFLVLVFSCLSLSAYSEPPRSGEGIQHLTFLVEKAASLIEKDGKDVFPQLRKKDGEWWKGDLYVFVDSMEGIVLVHPFDTRIEGQNLLKDPESKGVMALLIEKAKTDGSGVVEYMWPKPGETSPSKKISYIKKVKMPDGMEVIVGAGMYEK